MYFSTRQLATDPNHWDRMKLAEYRWHKARQITWEAVRHENITPLIIGTVRYSKGL